MYLRHYITWQDLGIAVTRHSGTAVLCIVVTGYSGTGYSDRLLWVLRVDGAIFHITVLKPCVLRINYQIQAQVDCEIHFAAEDDSFLKTGDKETIDIFVLRVSKHPNKFGFQREGGKSTDIVADFQNADSEEKLEFSMNWWTISHDDGFVYDVGNQFYEKSPQSTSLHVDVSPFTSQYFWAGKL